MRITPNPDAADLTVARPDETSQGAWLYRVRLAVDADGYLMWRTGSIVWIQTDADSERSFGRVLFVTWDDGVREDPITYHVQVLSGEDRGTKTWLSSTCVWPTTLLERLAAESL